MSHRKFRLSKCVVGLMAAVSLIGSFVFPQGAMSRESEQTWKNDFDALQKGLSAEKGACIRAQYPNFWRKVSMPTGRQLYFFQEIVVPEMQEQDTAYVIPVGEVYMTPENKVVDYGSFFDGGPRIFLPAEQNVGALSAEQERTFGVIRSCESKIVPLPEDKKQAWEQCASESLGATVHLSGGFPAISVSVSFRGAMGNTMVYPLYAAKAETGSREGIVWKRNGDGLPLSYLDKLIYCARKIGIQSLSAE